MDLDQLFNYNRMRGKEGGGGGQGGAGGTREGHTSVYVVRKYMALSYSDPVKMFYRSSLKYCGKLESWAN